MSTPTIQSMVDSIEREAQAYDVGKLQKLRLSLRGLQRTQTARIFGQGVSEDGGFAYHSGGREELQFNVGWDGDGDRDCVRAGVAFSFERSRSLPDVDLLAPLALRFNTFIELNADAFPEALMWHWQDDKRSADYPPTSIPSYLMRHKTFVFMGVRRPIDAFEPHWALQAFDRLLPIYRFVMAHGATIPTLEAPAPFVFRPRRISGDAISMRVSTTARELDVSLRHRLIQKHLCDELTTQLGPEKVSEEAIVCGCRADVITSEEQGHVIYEIKTCHTARACLREAIGQLLEYGFWPAALRPARLVVCGEPALDAEASAYLKTINVAFPASLEYKQVVLT